MLEFQLQQTFFFFSKSISEGMNGITSFDYRRAHPLGRAKVIVLNGLPFVI